MTKNSPAPVQEAASPKSIQILRNEETKSCAHIIALSLLIERKKESI
jgi:hypothetical protein